MSDNSKIDLLPFLQQHDPFKLRGVADRLRANAVGKVSPTHDRDVFMRAMDKFRESLSATGVTAQCR